MDDMNLSLVTEEDYKTKSDDQIAKELIEKAKKLGVYKKEETKLEIKEGTLKEEVQPVNDDSLVEPEIETSETTEIPMKDEDPFSEGVEFIEDPDFLGDLSEMPDEETIEEPVNTAPAGPETAVSSELDEEIKSVLKQYPQIDRSKFNRFPNVESIETARMFIEATRILIYCCNSTSKESVKKDLKQKIDKVMPIFTKLYAQIGKLDRMGFIGKHSSKIMIEMVVSKNYKDISEIVDIIIKFKPKYGTKEEPFRTHGVPSHMYEDESPGYVEE